MNDDPWLSLKLNTARKLSSQYALYIGIFKQYVLFVFRLFVILAISRFGFECSIWVLIASSSWSLHTCHKLHVNKLYKITVQREL